MNVSFYGGLSMGGFKESTVIILLIDQNGKLFYCNKQEGCDWIKIANEIANDLEITSYIKEGKFGERILKDYLVNIQEISLHNEKMYLIMLDKVVDQHAIHSVFLDYHTGLFNRNLWEYLHQGLTNLLNCQTYSVILIDIDNLKEINDTEGHIAGDMAIKILADTIKEAIRKEDIVIRLGGDEFLIILPNITVGVSNKVINRARNILQEKCKAKNIKIDISAGVSFGNQLDCIQNIVQRADGNMYVEKRNKKKIKANIKQEQIKELLEKTTFILNSLHESSGGFKKDQEVQKTSERLRVLISDLNYDHNLEEGE
jgi:diguanylate cyclase (GGDEF)-like protein